MLSFFICLRDKITDDCKVKYIAISLTTLMINELVNTYLGRRNQVCVGSYTLFHSLILTL